MCASFNLLFITMQRFNESDDGVEEFCSVIFLLKLPYQDISGEFSHVGRRQKKIWKTETMNFKPY